MTTLRAYATTLENIVHLVVPRIADWCAIDLTQDDGSLRRAAARLADPDKRVGLPAQPDPFMRATNASERHFPGLGLGLAISRQIVEHHGGTIRVARSGPNTGTTFEVTLPVTGSPNMEKPDQVLLPYPLGNTSGSELGALSG